MRAPATAWMRGCVRAWDAAHASVKIKAVFLFFSGYFEDLYVLDLSLMTWSDISSELQGQPPSPRALHSFVAAGGRIYIFGGIGLRGNSE